MNKDTDKVPQWQDEFFKHELTMYESMYEASDWSKGVTIALCATVLVLGAVLIALMIVAQ